jgi:hypothetical protein
VLNNKLNLKGLAFYKKVNWVIYFSNLKGLNLNTSSYLGASNPFIAINSYLSIEFRYSKFGIYNDDGNLIEMNSTECSSYSLTSKDNFFTKIEELVLISNMFASKLCPMWFISSKLNSLVIDTVSNSFINKNQFEFIDVDPAGGRNLVSYLNLIQITISYEHLTSRIFNRYLFKNAISLVIYGNNIYDVEYDLFKYFSKLNKLIIFINNIKQFYHENRNEWMSSLKHFADSYNVDDYIIKRNKITVNMVLVLVEMTSDFGFYKPYEYPDEDFCLFSHFPHNKLIYPVVDPGKKINCSCTILWLMKYTNIYSNLFSSRVDNYFSFYQYYFKNMPGQFDYVFISLLYCLFEKNYMNLLLKCDFEKKIKLCNKTDFNLTENNLLNEIPSNIFVLKTDEDLINLTKLIEYILLVILNPVFAFFGMVTNLMVIIVIYNLKNLKRNNKIELKNIKDNMFKYILIHSVFNVIYCFIMSFKSINECLIFTSSLFCSSVYTSTSAQSFKIIFIEFLGNIAKTCSNSSYVAITLSRIALMSNKSKNWLKKFENINKTVFLIAMVAFSSLLSTYKLFEFKINRFENTEINQNDFPSEKKNFYFCSKLEMHLFECEILAIIEIINNLINDIFFLILTIILDVMVLKGLTNMINSKKVMVENFKEHEEKKKRNRVQKMIIINCLVYIISHAPELISSILLLIYEKKLILCVKYFRCDKLNEMAQFFIYIPIIFQFFINKNFNTLFKDSYHQIIFSIKNKFKKFNQTDQK